MECAAAYSIQQCAHDAAVDGADRVVASFPGLAGEEQSPAHAELCRELLA